ncbi:uncharacterized protein (TIGR04222 family) [Rhodopirellula rubra]|uniref:Uncharacterized protein (TIGR04222 family) n=1 Tax=Aporhodopirellula rubra TaxID=980271 RepID=A0A7W5H545_9BACT|nr:TIGR04222 domain-containing membrane protein [Aporhodopirellula rubra]MBB3207052.1 uncharacterized protein (TIGR04222 family) [Aporhodopirellula rubra]
MKLNHEFVDHDTLWQDISHFSIGGEPADWTVPPANRGLAFSQRLARENNWEIEYARQCIDEYRRFLFLAATAGHSVTPSDAVDQVWHQHLVYTENYWIDLCQNVLPAPLHHGPTKGGSQERVRYQDQYERTLASYEKAFGAAPAEVWPSTEERFAQSVSSVRIDRRKYWLVPKIAFGRPGVSGSHYAIGGLAVTPLAALFPFNLHGPQFLAANGLAIATGLAFLWIWFHISNGRSTDNRLSSRLGWGQLAVLTGGKRRLLQTTLVALQKRGVVSCDQQVFSIVNRHALQVQRDDDPIAIGSMEAIADYLEESKQPQTLKRLMLAIHSTAANAETQMSDSGLLRSSYQRSRFYSGAFGIAMVLLLVGGIRCLQGLDNNRPIGLLVLEMVIAVIGILAAMHWASRVRLSAAGRAVQQRAQYDLPETNLKLYREDANADFDELPYLAFWGPVAAAYLFSDPSDLWANEMLYAEEVSAMEKASTAGGWADWTSTGDGGSSGGLFDSFGLGDSSGGGDAGCGGGCGGCGGCGG